jgi:hypothetical protein
VLIRATPSSISTRNWSRTVLKNRSILPFVVAARGLAWINFTPKTAQARSSCEDTNADPRSTFCSRAGYVAARLTLGVVTVDGGIVVFLSGT